MNVSDDNNIDRDALVAHFLEHARNQDNVVRARVCAFAFALEWENDPAKRANISGQLVELAVNIR